MAKFISSFKYVLLALTALFLTSCASSLPEGASTPKLKVEGLSLSNQDDQPKFVISYTIEHKSQSALPIKAIDADVFLNNVKVATLSKKITNENIAPNEKQQLSLEVPVNLVGDASIDSMTNNSLLVLQGSCALTVHFTEDEELVSFHPSNSYSGLVSVLR
ncbi:hypothetical protein MXE38_02620 [Anaerobiospirillum sp. NML120448]|uniref:hypothetical protein n=1 Tax=Anaerobiospirillum sp. NML120448 TaxID=2932816 RepID=UPI001FF34CDE|nr:hypothetical protein [Anaerobiospirillum sp. NML120448]MCK0513767.1 hypothetical protein [Anaerobiospirillum sp. NML120448]